MANALTEAVEPSPPPELAAWVNGLAGDELARLARRVADIESGRADDVVEVPAPARVRGRAPDEATAAMGALEPEVARPDGGPASAGAVATASSRSSFAKPWAKVAAAAFVGLIGLFVVRRVVLGGSGSATHEGAPSVDAVAAASSGPTSAPASAEASPASASRAPAVPAPPASSPTPRKRTSAPPRVARPDCNPPYREVVIGANVRRVPKQECL
jgi:hypothetical protein